MLYLIGNKLSYLNEVDCKQVESEFNQLKEQIYLCKADALKLYEQEEEAKKDGGLPPGIVPPDFYGDPNTYPIWCESFNAIVHQNEKYNYRYLRQVMKGDAEQCLNGFSPLVENYKKAIKHVKERYGQPRKVVRHIMKSVIEMSLVSEDHKQLRTYYDNIVGKIYDLKSYASQLENLVDAIIVPLLESKLTKTLKQSWEKELITSIPDNEFATLEGYVEWCLKELRAREVVFESQKEKNQESKIVPMYKSSDHYSSQALISGTRCVGQNVNCLFCNKSHRLENCFGFQKVSVEERWDFA